MHRFGAALNRHVHFHCCVIDGVFEDGGDGQVQFRPAQALTPEAFAAIAAPGLSPGPLCRLKAQWSEEYQGWTRRDLSGRQYAYWWVDGIYTTLRETDDPRLCLLVIIGVTADGTKEWVAISDGLRESTAAWLDVLRDLKVRGLAVGPRLAVGDSALGFWAALEQVYPDTVHQRCWFHKMGNVLAALPKHLQGQAKSDLQAIPEVTA